VSTAGGDLTAPAPAIATGPGTSTGAGAPAGVQYRLASARDAHLRGLSFYPILIVAALAVIGGATLARYVGVRLWSS
jgi:hypothetical protein